LMGEPWLPQMMMSRRWWVCVCVCACVCKWCVCVCVRVQMVCARACVCEWWVLLDVCLHVPGGWGRGLWVACCCVVGQQ
jgi:hypothetical protein